MAKERNEEFPSKSGTGSESEGRKRKRMSFGSTSSDDDEDSCTSSSESEFSDSYSDTESSSSEDSSESEDERKRRRRKERRKRKERKKEKRRRRKEKEKEKEKKKRRKKEKEKEKKEEIRKKKHKKKKKNKDKGKKSAVTNSWGKYGIIRETDMWNKRPEFTAWLAEVKQVNHDEILYFLAQKVNMESLPNWEEKQMFKEFMEDHNTATFPSKKYYDLDTYHRRQMEKEMKRGPRKVQETERIIFNDEEQRRQELRREREILKEEQVEALKRSMQGGMAQAMKEQARLKEEMAYQYKIGNIEAAAAIQRRLDPDIPM